MKGSSIAMIVRILGVISTYIYTLIITKFFDASGMGIFALSQTILMIATIYAKLGIDTASIRIISENFSNNKIDKIKKFYSTSLKIITFNSLLVSFILFLLADFIAFNLLEKQS